MRTSITSQPAYPGDIALALEQAAAYASAQGGGVITIPSGTFYLDRPVLITQDNVILRGAGGESTKFVFRYMPQGVSFYKPVDGASVTKNGWIEVHANPVNLSKITLKSGATTIKEVVAVTPPGAFSLTSAGTACIKKIGPGIKVLTAVATYSDGSTLTRDITVNLVNGTDPNSYLVPLQLGAINFYGGGEVGGQFLLAANGVRGDTALTLAAGHGIAVGDKIQLTAPATAAWNAAVQNACTANVNDFREYLYEVLSVSGNVITLNQPLRIDYPVSDGSFIQKFVPISGCGVENLSLTQNANLRTNGITFSKAWKCWARNVKVTKTGWNPLYFLASKWCEIRDCVFDDQWVSVSYVGWERCYDCLMDGITTRGVRHAPLLQWSAAGNVIRNSAFYDSDAQWHAGWTNENLIENCVVESNFGSGGYGYGMWSSPPNDASHGPNGPRNVIYNSDISSPLAGVWLGGQNKGWIFRYNRMATDAGQGIFAQKDSSGHIIRDNVFSMRNSANGVWLNDTTCAGIQIVNNTFRGVAGASGIVGGAMGASLLQGNAATDTLAKLSFANSGFENGLTTWTTTDAMFQGVSSAAHAGSAGLRVTDDSTASGGLLYSQTFTVQPGKGYAIRYWAKTVSGTDPKAVGVYLYYYDAAGKKISSFPGYVPLNAFWGQYVVEQVAPTNAATARVFVRTLVEATVQMDMDDFEFGQIPFEIPNNGFESGTLAQWSVVGDNGMSAASAAAAYQSGFGVRVQDGSTTLQSKLSSATLPAVPGNCYQTRFWARVTSGTGMSVDFLFLDANGANLGQVTQDIPSNTSEWRQYVLRADAPAGAVSVYLQVHSHADAVVTADFDNFIFSESDPRPVAATPSIFDWQRQGGSLPAAPAGLSATGSYKKILLAWSPVAGASSYSIKRALAAEGPFVTVATGVSASSYSDFIGLMGATRYYVITAVNAAGESGPSNVAHATTLP
ncbi:MAG: carbohydrate binding domain-containing protein [Terrimicrobiaceae bacterium]